MGGPVTADSTTPGVPGVLGTSLDCRGVEGRSTSDHGILGTSDKGNGVVGHTSGDPAGGTAGVFGEHLANGTGVVGKSQGGYGVAGISQNNNGFFGASQTGFGIEANSTDNHGVVGRSAKANGVVGHTSGDPRGGTAGVFGEHLANGTGVVGKSQGGYGVAGISQSSVGVQAFSETFEAVHAETKSSTTAAIAAYNLNAVGTGAAVFAQKVGNIGHAGFFDGDVHVTRTLSVDGDVMLMNGDCAEEFEVQDPNLASPGAVMIIGDDGLVRPCDSPYDRRVVGVVAGAGAYKPALVLDRRGGLRRRPISLLGKVCCLVDASYGAVSAGDMLTTSETVGHAMRAEDPARKSGAVIGKALAGLQDGRGLIPMLVALQ